MYCNHARTRELRTRCFVGSVAGLYGDENRAAHGNVTVDEECVRCGAQRSVNVNRCHVETGPWGPTRAERVQAARVELGRVQAAVPVAPEPVELVHADGRRVRVAVDSDGYIVITPAVQGAEERSVLAALPEGWFERARDVRRGVLRLRAAQAALEDAEH